MFQVSVIDYSGRHSGTRFGLVGPQGDQWHKAYVNLKEDESPFQVSGSRLSGKS